MDLQRQRVNQEVEESRHQISDRCKWSWLRGSRRNRLDPEKLANVLFPKPKVSKEFKNYMYKSTDKNISPVTAVQLFLWKVTKNMNSCSIEYKKNNRLTAETVPRYNGKQLMGVSFIGSLMKKITKKAQKYLNKIYIGHYVHNCVRVMQDVIQFTSQCLVPLLIYLMQKKRCLVTKVTLCPSSNNIVRANSFIKFPRIS